MTDLTALKENIAAAMDELSAYPGARLLAATKTVPAEVINYAVHHGLDLIGDNRIQEMEQKLPLLVNEPEH
ncbi:MAG: YggS family pyridoxal phosphate-dependent enzyme, partial [Clostridia bacterium]|nr:YggS family pyridoxal phosphate-dependent enzyme [Clostridia bacterium]